MAETQGKNLPETMDVIPEEAGTTDETNTPLKETVAAVIPEEISEEVTIVEEAPESVPEEALDTTQSEITEPCVSSDVPASEAPLEEATPLLEQESSPLPETETPEEVIAEEEEPVHEQETEEPAPEAETEETAPEAEPEEQTPPEEMSKAAIVDRLTLIVSEADKHGRLEVDALKKNYYRQRKREIEAAKKAHFESGGKDENFILPADSYEVQIKSLLAEYREKRKTLEVEEERTRENNLLLKQHLVERLKTLTEGQGDFGQRLIEFHEIQRKWREISLVPQDKHRELARTYSLYNERFFDLIKINNQLRDLDYKKNYEMKVLLCEKAEALVTKSDPGYAFQQALKLQEQWREIGPVAKSLRDEIWERFKTAVDEVVKKYRSHNEKIRAREEANYTEKEALCIILEAIDFDKMKSARDWERTTAEVLAHQAKWRTIGPAPRKVHNKIYERFRAACDLYFSRKNEFFKNVKADMEKNLELKRALVEKAEELKNSTEWKETAKKIADLQVQWKKIGPVSRKYSDAVWKQFIAAFDYFYEQRAKATSAGKSEEYSNLEAKKTVIQNISSIDEALNYDEALALLRDYIAEWNKIGFVPIREKEKLHKAFRSAVDAQFDRLKVSERDRRLQQFRSNVTELAGAGKNKKLYSERDRLMRVYERMKNELQTYQNNIGFLSVSSKGADGLMKEVDRKMAALKEDMEVIIKKIETIDENLD